MRKFLLVILATISFAGCAPRSIDSYHTGESEEEVTRLLNEREYGKAVWLIESKHGKNPSDRTMAFLLGQAYLGKVGFEPLKVAARVSEPQDFSSEGGRLLFPACAAGKLGSVKGVGVLCLLKRVYLQVPDADREEFTRARELFRRAWPVPSESPEWVNVLVGMVETASVVKRVGAIYVFVLALDGRQPTEEELQWLVRQAKRTVNEGREALSRADHSGQKISQLLTGSSEAELFQKARGAIDWADRLGLGTLFDLFRGYMVDPAHEARYAEALNRIRELLEEQNALLTKR